MSRKMSSSSEETTQPVRAQTQEAKGKSKVNGQPPRVTRHQYLLFTGPDNLRDQRVSTVDERLFIGENSCSPEMTNSMGYFLKAAPGEEFPKARGAAIGEIGWQCQDFTQQL